MENIPNDLLYDIVIKLDFKDIFYLCLINNNLNKKICQNDLFWKRLFKYQFGFIKDDYLIPGANFLEEKFKYLFGDIAPILCKEATYFLISFIDVINDIYDIDSCHDEKDIITLKENDIEHTKFFFDNQTILNILKYTYIDYGYKLLYDYIYLKYNKVNTYKASDNIINNVNNNKEYINDFFTPEMEKSMTEFVFFNFLEQFTEKDKEYLIKYYRKENIDNIFDDLVEDVYFKSYSNPKSFKGSNNKIIFFNFDTSIENFILQNKMISGLRDKINENYFFKIDKNILLKKINNIIISDYIQGRIVSPIKFLTRGIFYQEKYSKNKIVDFYNFLSNNDLRKLAVVYNINPYQNMGNIINKIIIRQKKIIKEIKYPDVFETSFRIVEVK